MYWYHMTSRSLCKWTAFSTAKQWQRALCHCGAMMSMYTYTHAAHKSKSASSPNQQPNTMIAPTCLADALWKKGFWKILYWEEPAHYHVLMFASPSNVMTATPAAMHPAQGDEPWVHFKKKQLSWCPAGTGTSHVCEAWHLPGQFRHIAAVLSNFWIFCSLPRLRQTFWSLTLPYCDRRAASVCIQNL